MAEKVLKDLIQLKNLKTKRITKFSGGMVYIRYDAVIDAFYLMVAPPATETAVYHLDDQIGLIFEPETREVVGFQIEAFQRVFAGKHAALMESLAAEESANVFTAMTRQKPLIVRNIVTASAPALKKRNITISNDLKNTPSRNIAYV